MIRKKTRKLQITKLVMGGGNYSKDVKTNKQILLITFYADIFGNLGNNDPFLVRTSILTQEEILLWHRS